MRRLSALFTGDADGTRSPKRGQSPKRGVLRTNSAKQQSPSTTLTESNNDGRVAIRVATATDDDTAAEEVTDGQLAHVVSVEIEENERLNTKSGSPSWGPENLTPSDPKRYDSPEGQTSEFPKIRATTGWFFVGNWEVDRSMPEYDSEGYVYSTSFLDLDLGHYSKASSATVVRRRRWVRKMVPSTSTDPSTLKPAGMGAMRETPDSSLQSTSQILSANTLKSNHNTSQSQMGTTPPGSVMGGDDNMTDIGTFDMEFDEDDTGSINMMRDRDGDAETETSSQNGDGTNSEFGGSQQSVKHGNNSTMGSVAGDAAPKKRGFFSWGRDKGDASPVASRGGTRTPPKHTGKKSMPKRTMYVPNPALRLNDPTLVAMGKQIRHMEGECRKEDEATKLEWTKLLKPKLEMQISELGKRCAEIEKKIEDQVASGDTDLTKLDEEMKIFTEKLDDCKRKLYFPDSRITVGQAGVYLAVDDLWLEHVSGNFRVDIVPDKLKPQINVQFVPASPGAAVGAAALNEKQCGLTIRLKAEKFKLKGDKGLGVPPLSFDNLKVTIALNAAIQITFDVKTSKWIMDKKQFKLEILSFRGPYGINRSMVTAILSMVNPLIRKALVDALPPELGFLLRSLPSAFCVQGDFDITGVDLQVLSDPLTDCTALLEMSRYQPVQLDMFIQLQQSLGFKTILRSLSDLISYKRNYANNADRWEQICFYWEQAAASYCYQIVTARMDSMGGDGSAPNSPNGEAVGVTGLQAIDMNDLVFNFQTLVNAGDEISKKRLVTNFKLRYIDGQVSLNHMMSFVHQLLYRVTHEAWVKAKTPVEEARLSLALEALGHNNDALMEILRLITKNLDFAQLTLLTGIHAGPQGEIKVAVKDILIQAPVFIQLNLFQELNIGSLPLVPYIVSIKPKDNGDVYIEIFHFTHAAMIDNRPDSDDDSDDNDDKKAEKAERNRRKSLTAESTIAPASGQHFVQTRRGSYNISAFNNAVNAITAKSTTAHGGSAGTPDMKMLGGARRGSSGAAADTTTDTAAPPPVGVGAPAEARRRGSSSFGTHEGLRSEEKARAIKQALNDHPEGENADTIITVAARKPHVSMIVDAACTLKPGAELFSLNIGPQDKEYQAFGTGNRFNEEDGVSLGYLDTSSGTSKHAQAAANRIAENQKLTEEFTKGMKANQAVALHAAAAAAKRAVAAAEKAQLPPPPGCPIAMQTAPGIKMLIQVPRADVNINLAGLLRFVLSHFDDLQLLKEFLDSLLGIPFYVHHLSLVKLIIEKVAKYLVLPGVDIDININGKIVTLNHEIMIRVETPEDFQVDNEAGQQGTGGGSSGSSRNNNNNIHVTREAPSAIVLRAELNLQDVMQDGIDIEGYLKNSREIEEQLQLRKEQQQQQQQATGSEAAEKKKKKAGVTEKAEKKDTPDSNSSSSK